MISDQYGRIKSTTQNSRLSRRVLSGTGAVQLILGGETERLLVE